MAKGKNGSTGPKGISEAKYAAALTKHAGIYARAAKELGVARETVKERVEKSAVLQAVCANVEETVLDAVESVILDAIVSKQDIQTARWYAVQKGKSRGYGNRTETEFRLSDDDAGAVLGRVGRGDVEKLRDLRAAVGSKTPG